MTNKINIKTHDYFPFHFIVVGVACIFLSIVVAPIYPLFSLFLFPCGFLFITTHYRLLIDDQQKVFKEYLWIMGFRRGVLQPYQRIWEIHVRTENQKIEYGLVSRVSGSKYVYTANILLDEELSLFVGENSSEKRLIKKVNKIADTLQTKITKSY